MSEPKPTCFAIMPISVPADSLEKYGSTNHFLRIAKYLFRPAAEAAGYEFRAPRSTTSEVIAAEIIGQLETADLVLCDVSMWNPNVFFELGIRVALDRPVAMIRDEHTGSLPFDTAMVNCHGYNSSLDIESVEAEVPKLTDFIRTSSKQTQNALWRYFGITQRAIPVESSESDGAVHMLQLLIAEVQSLRGGVNTLQGEFARPSRYLPSDHGTSPAPGELVVQELAPLLSIPYTLKFSDNTAVLRISDSTSDARRVDRATEILRKYYGPQVRIYIEPIPIEQLEPGDSTLPPGISAYDPDDFV